MTSRKLETISKVFNINSLMEMPTTKKGVAKYYKVNRIPYAVFNSSQGFVHMGISKNSEFDASDFYAQSRQVSKYIEKLGAEKVLELGMGKGANLKYLASRHASVQFFGLDLPNGQLNTNRLRRFKNLQAEVGDFNDLSRYRTKSIDIVFMVEAFSYAESKLHVLNEIARILKPSGLLIVYEGYNRVSFDSMSNEEETLVRLGWLGMAINPENVSLKSFKSALADTGFKIQEETNLNKQIMPSLKRLEANSVKYFKHPLTARVIDKIFPRSFTANAVSGYLMPWAIKSNLAVYLLTVAKLKEER